MGEFGRICAMGCNRISDGPQTLVLESLELQGSSGQAGSSTKDLPMCINSIRALVPLTAAGGRTDCPQIHQHANRAMNYYKLPDAFCAG